jgi:hypothetical protein
MILNIKNVAVVSHEGIKHLKKKHLLIEDKFKLHLPRPHPIHTSGCGISIGIESTPMKRKQSSVYTIQLKRHC